MKRWIFVIIVLILSGCATSQQVRKPDFVLDVSGEPGILWRTLKPASGNVEIRYPATWWFQDSGQVILFSPAPRNQWMRGVGYPPPPSPWLILSEDGKGNCAERIKQRKDFSHEEVGVEGGEKIWERTVCRLGYAVSFGYWDSTPNKTEVRRILNFMLESLHERK